jgi:hypothetical protein
MSVVLAILWIALFVIAPIWVGIRLCQSRGESAWLGGLLGFVFSWLGVLITWLIVRNKGSRTQPAEL